MNLKGIIGEGIFEIGAPTFRPSWRMDKEIWK